MIQLLFGWIGFGFKNGTFKGISLFGEKREYHSVVLLLGLVAIIWNNDAMFQKWMYLLKTLSTDDLNKLANYEIEIDKRCKDVIEEKEKTYQSWKESHIIAREQTHKLLAEANTRVRDLEITVKILTQFKETR